MSKTEAPVEGAAESARQFVTFQVDGALYGLPMAEVQEIIRMPALVEVPHSPAALSGIANLRGGILPVTSLRRAFGAADQAADEATRVVVVRESGAAQGFIVDRMARVMASEPQEIEAAGDMEHGLGTSLLRGVVKREDGLVLLLDLARIAALGRARNEAGPARATGLAGAAEAEVATTQEELQFVSFLCAGTEYAMPIGEVREIVQLPPDVVRVPRAGAEMLGLMTLRERLLPLVSLRALFGEAPEAPGASARVLVIAVPGRPQLSVGLVMDSVKEVLRVPRSLVDPLPSLLTGAQHLDSICRLEGGKRLVSILSAARMFEAGLMQSALDATQEEDGMAEDNAATAIEEEEQFVIFRLAGEEYGLAIEAVQEILRVPPELTQVPQTPDFIEGVVNLRGAVLPVVDQRRRFALAQAERNERQRIMVLGIGGTRTGFIVDQVVEVLRIPRSAMQPAPRLSERQMGIIPRVANLAEAKRMVLILEAPRLLEAGEVAALEAA
ncbi:MAG: chemotaxis protein CheW [Roseococcus sp.]|nr:chemotaxis protein CheW [Roseococcus sp.]